jgi:hypothetical protein
MVWVSALPSLECTHVVPQLFPVVNGWLPLLQHRCEAVVADTSTRSRTHYLFECPRQLLLPPCCSPPLPSFSPLLCCRSFVFPNGSATGERQRQAGGKRPADKAQLGWQGSMRVIVGRVRGLSCGVEITEDPVCVKGRPLARLDRSRAAATQGRKGQGRGTGRRGGKEGGCG